jgi:hypothetical protein
MTFLSVKKSRIVRRLESPRTFSYFLIRNSRAATVARLRGKVEMDFSLPLNGMSSPGLSTCSHGMSPQTHLREGCDQQLVLSVL